MKNNKGFVLTETLVVTVFLVTIFTFIYVSIIPLMGKYEDLISHNSNIDIVYKLYNIRKLMKEDDSKYSMTNYSINQITCSSFANLNYCNKMMDYLELNSYILLFVGDIQSNINNIKTYSQLMYDYIFEYRETKGKVLILLDKDTGEIAHLLYN